MGKINTYILVFTKNETIQKEQKHLKTHIFFIYKV